MEEKLIAIYPILFESHQYKIGDELPASNHDMVKIWLESGVAEWRNSEETQDNFSEDVEKTEETQEDFIESVDIIENEKEDKIDEKLATKDKQIKNQIGRRNNKNGNDV
ncbi:hypothetical protein [Clostridium ihumii]|uniref:hypothetical protein n=1 Tax=Clostridium ihumii TaxID=1470356 RepID=UPI0005579C7A|nr:hypothetical protein [Clostridium ihumii]